jgi:LuxR family transcriptional regulator, quorum-sensing system regulator SdiA
MVSAQGYPTLTSQSKKLAELYDELQTLAPHGYAVGLHIRFATPLVYHSRYPEAWVEYYNANSYYLRDPMVFWGIGTTGTRRWSEIPLPDPFGLLKKARSYGMNYGAVSSYGPITSRSMVGITRSDREFNDNELEALADVTTRLHIAAKPPSELTRSQIEALQCIANGDRHAAAAEKLGISESAFKARLQSARVRLEARTTSEAVRKAREYRML